ncbi:MAG: aldo/keto reductase [Acidobacteria bacterium]|nr:aldo/keto reductase [Acidobacteriota bacterium]MCI0721438.1 aldo/keto reductase [Acidobacteriota bacterium]
MNSPSEVFRPLGSTGLSCHPLGFGCYRIADGNAEHEAALRDYLKRGGNLIDTSANYTDGHSEILVGKVLKDYARDRVIVVTKAGYIQGQNMRLAQSQPFPEVVKYGEGIWHCIHPEFLDTQISFSCQRLQLETIDVFLLHNPEYFLSHQAHHKDLDAADHSEFYRRIGQAFRFLEDQVQRGKIRWYGISSNNFGLPLSEPDRTSVERCLAEAEKISPEHHFRVIQLPMNLYESGGALEKNNAGETVLEFCRRHELGVLVNRPLNAFFNHRLVRLADFATPGEKVGKADLAALLDALRQHEQALSSELEVSSIAGRGTGLAALLEQIVPQVSSVEHWEQIVARHVIVPLQRWIEENGRRHGNNILWGSWIQEFFPLLHATLDEVERFVQAQQQSSSDAVRIRFRRAGYPESSGSLSQMALNLLMSVDELSCVLLGMRRSSYVQDAFESLRLPAVDALAVLKNFQKQL